VIVNQNRHDRYLRQDRNRLPRLPGVMVFHAFLREIHGIYLKSPWAAPAKATRIAVLKRWAKAKTRPSGIHSDAFRMLLTFDCRWKPAIRS